MSRSLGSPSLTSLPATRNSPSLTPSRPATMRRTVVLPQPDGPTSTTSSPSSIASVSSRTALVPSGKTLVTPEKLTSATYRSLPSRQRRHQPRRDVAAEAKREHDRGDHR